MARIQLGLLSFGVFLIIVAVWIATWVLTIIPAGNIVPLILFCAGVWTVIIACVKVFKPEEKGGTFSTFGWGMLFIVLGGSLYMVNMGMDPVYAAVFVLASIGALIAVVALKSGRK